MATNAGSKTIARNEKRMEKERKRQVELANKMLIPVGKKTESSLGLISFDPSGVFRLKENRWMRVYQVDGNLKALARNSLNLSGRIRVVMSLGEDGGRDTCHLILMENGEIYEEVRQLMSKDEEVIRGAVGITALNVDEVMRSIKVWFGIDSHFSYASYVRGNKDWKKECFLEIKEETAKFTVGRLYGESFHALSYPSIIKEGFIRAIRELGCRCYISLDVNSLTAEEQLDFNRAIEKRYNRRLVPGKGENYLNVSLALVILCDSDDAREIIEKTVIAVANNYEIMMSASFHAQEEVAMSILSFGLLDSKIMRNVKVEVVENLMGGEADEDAKIKV